jgi:iron(III) transport system substrate-binding protein
MIINNNYRRVSMKRLKVFLVAALVLFVFTLAAGCTSSATDNESGEVKVVNLYTDRHYDTDDELYAQFTEETGIEVNVVKGKSDELIERLKTEGADTEADLLITADVGRLERAKIEGLFQTVDSEILVSNIPEKYRDPDVQWFGLTKRARVIVYAKDKVDGTQISTYEDLTKPAWKGRVLIRSSENIYNQSLLASFIELKGYEQAKAWAESMVVNFARDPDGGDRDQATAVAAGEGDVAVMNTYYLGQMLNSANEEEVKVAQSLGVIFPDQDGNGTHVNISGGGVVANAKNAENAKKLLEYLASARAQESYAKANYEYPVLENIELSDFLISLGDFKEQSIALSKLGELNAEAVKAFNEAGWK